MSCRRGPGLWLRLGRALYANPRSIILAIAGLGLTVAGVFLEGEVGVTLLVLGVGVLVLGVVLPIVGEVELGPGGLKFKQAERELDDELGPVLLEEQERQSLQRFAALLAGDTDQAAGFVEEALARTYAVLHSMAPEERQAHVLCALVRLVLGMSTLHLGPPPSAARGNQASKEMIDALGSLSSYQRAIVLLRHYRDVEEKDIAWIADRHVEEIRADLREAESRMEQDLAGTAPGS